MNQNEFDRTARAWLQDGPTRISDRVVLSALEEIHATRQRRAWWPARRATPVNIFVRAAIAAVFVVGVGLVAVNVLPGQPDGSGVGGPPSASPSPSASPLVPELTQTYVSSNNGFSIGYSDDAVIERSAVVWNPLVDQENKHFDFINNETFGTFRGSSTEAPQGVSIDDWFDQSIVHYAPSGCGAPRSEQNGYTIDGQPGRIWEGCPGEIEASVVVGQRVYLFTLLSEAKEARAIFDAYASTIDLRPEEAASPAP
jgi:hypothetical protein